MRPRGRAHHGSKGESRNEVRIREQGFERHQDRLGDAEAGAALDDHRLAERLLPSKPDHDDPAKQYDDAGLTAPGPGSEPAQICRFKIATTPTSQVA